MAPGSIQPGSNFASSITEAIRRSRALLAASYGHLGRVGESRAEWAEVMRINPDYSLAHRRKILPY